MVMPQKRETERITIPHEQAQMVLRRCDGLLRACVWDENVLNSLILSCYLQGLQDGVQVVAHHPEVLEWFREQKSEPLS